MYSGALSPSRVVNSPTSSSTAPPAEVTTSSRCSLVPTTRARTSPQSASEPKVPARSKLYIASKSIPALWKKAMLTSCTAAETMLPVNGERAIGAQNSLSSVGRS